MSMIDSEAQDFTVRAYQDYEFRPVTKEDLKGNGAYSSSIRLTSPSSARPNSGPPEPLRSIQEDQL